MTPASAPYILPLVRVSERGRVLFILAVGAFWAWVTLFNAWAGLRGPALRVLRGPDVGRRLRRSCAGPLPVPRQGWQAARAAKVYTCSGLR